MINFRKLKSRRYYSPKSEHSVGDYVTIQDIIRAVRNDFAVKVTCVVTKNDITNDTLRFALTRLDIDTQSLLNLIKERK